MWGGYEPYDFVYSIGLVEHFESDARKEVIKGHFDLVKNGGYVLISFPTPTLKYCFWRRVMEIFHVWQFWDERPFFYEEIADCLSEFGEVKEVILNRKLFLTQTLVFVKAGRKAGDNV